MPSVTACVEESEEKQDCHLVLPASPLGCKSDGPFCASSGNAKGTGFVGTGVALLVVLTTVLLVKEQGAAGPAKINRVCNLGIKRCTSFPTLLAVLVLPQGFHWEGKDFSLWGWSVGLLDTPAASPEI